MCCVNHGGIALCKSNFKKLYFVIPSHRGPEKSPSQIHSYSPSVVSIHCALLLQGLGLQGDTGEKLKTKVFNSTAYACVIIHKQWQNSSKTRSKFEMESFRCTLISSFNHFSHRWSYLLDIPV